MGFNFDFLLNLFYPPLCLHCDAYLEKGKKLFCSLCLEQLTLIDPLERCPTCFAETSGKKCPRCITRSRLIKRQAAACACFGPACTLASSLKKGHEERIDAAFSLLALQWAQLDWPPHDCVTALPLSPLRRLRGSDYNALLAKHMARHSGQPYIPFFKARFDREAFFKNGRFKTRYYLKGKAWDKRVLIIALELDDLAFREAAVLLQGAYAREIYTLALIDCTNDIQDADDRHALVDTQ